MIERFKRLPRRTHDVWQGGLVRARTWVEDPDGRVRRPWAAVWVSSATGMINMALAESERSPTRMWRCRFWPISGRNSRAVAPLASRWLDAALGAQLVEALGDPELAVTVRQGPAGGRPRLARGATLTGGGRVPTCPSALDARGVTVERMRAFADAALEFYRPHRGST